MFRRILIRAVRWGGFALAALVILYVLSIGPGTVLLMEAGPAAGLFEEQTGYNLWHALYEVPARNIPKPARKPAMGAMNWYMGKCTLGYYKVRGPGPRPGSR